MRTTVVGLIAAALLWAGAAEAARFETVRSARDLVGIVITGRISPGDDKRFRRLARGLDEAIVLLDSPGGDGIASLAIGLEVRARGFSTGVLPGADCASGCALIWLAGTRRFAHDTSAIGFHAASAPDENGRLRQSAEGNALVMEYLTGLGYSRATARQLISAPPTGMFWLSQRTARDLGITARTVEVPEPPTTASRRETGDWFDADRDNR